MKGKSSPFSGIIEVCVPKSKMGRLVWSRPDKIGHSWTTQILPIRTEQMVIGSVNVCASAGKRLTVRKQSHPTDRLD